MKKSTQKVPILNDVLYLGLPGLRVIKTLIEGSYRNKWGQPFELKTPLEIVYRRADCVPTRTTQRIKNAKPSLRRGSLRA
jgi:hypothetical protein